MAVLIGEDCRFQAEGSASSIWTTLTELVEVECPDIENEAVEIGDINATSKRKRANRIKDNGEFVVRCNRDSTDAVQVILKGLVATPPHPGSEQTFRLVYNNGTASRPHDEFDAFVSNYKMGDIAEGENIVDEYTLTVTGAITVGSTSIS
jgi:hypothetical protein